jgi:hypothetical protein
VLGAGTFLVRRVDRTPVFPAAEEPKLEQLVGRHGSGFRRSYGLQAQEGLLLEWAHAPGFERR